MNAIERGLSRAAYGAASTAKVGWYTLQYLRSRHAVELPEFPRT